MTAAFGPKLLCLPPEPPDDVPVAGEQIDRRHVPARDQHRAAGAVGDRIDVEIVERAFPAGVPGRFAVRLGRLGQRDVVDAVPFEEHAPGRDVDLLDDAVLDEAPLRPADAAQVGSNLTVGGDERCSARCQLELVQVAVETVARAHRGDVTVRRVVDLVLPFAGARDALGSLPPREHRPAVIALDPEIGCLLRWGDLVVPDDPAARIDDQRASGRPAFLLGDEDVAALRRGCAREHLDHRQVGSRDRVERDRADRCARPRGRAEEGAACGRAGQQSGSREPGSRACTHAAKHAGSNRRGGALGLRLDPDA